MLRLVRAVLVVGGVVTLTFALLHLAPGDPVQRLLGPAATAEQLAAARASLGLDRPLAEQYAAWLGQAVRGDFGTSISQGRPVAGILAEAWPATAMLVTLSIGLSWLFGIVIGAWQSATRSRAADALVSTATVALNAMPGYWLGLALVMLF
ncbi:MAG TPA: ABC transporter permease, partial [Gemmatimonadales bacterium]|nr:ABC transporter permease [Gemmatimonadales bacterium]